jgi:hypothetical protein
MTEDRLLRPLHEPKISVVGRMTAEELAVLVAWAEGRLATPPDFWVGDEADPQMERWYAVPRNRVSNVFLHRFRRDDPVFHDHPYGSTSLIVTSYREHLFNGSHEDRAAGDIVVRDALTAHRIGVIDGQPAVSLFFTGPWQRDWGFVYPDRGWVAAKDDPHYAATRHWRV